MTKNEDLACIVKHEGKSLCFSTSPYTGTYEQIGNKMKRDGLRPASYDELKSFLIANYHFGEKQRTYNDLISHKGEPEFEFPIVPVNDPKAEIGGENPYYLTGFRMITETRQISCGYCTPYITDQGQDRYHETPSEYLSWNSLHERTFLVMKDSFISANSFGDKTKWHLGVSFGIKQSQDEEETTKKEFKEELEDCYHPIKEEVKEIGKVIEMLSHKDSRKKAISHLNSIRLKAALYERNGCFKDAADCAYEYAKMYPYVNGWHEKASEMYEQAGQLEKAAECIQEIMRSDYKNTSKSKFYWSKKNIELLEKSGKFEKAADYATYLGSREYLEKAITLYEKEGKLSNAAECARKAKQYERALELYERDGEFKAALECAKEAQLKEKILLYTKINSLSE